VKSTGDRRLAESPEGCPGHQRADRISRRAVPAELYENILSKGNSGRSEAGSGHSSRSEVETACSQSSPQGAEGGNSQQKRYEKCGLVSRVNYAGGRGGATLLAPYCVGRRRKTGLAVRQGCRTSLGLRIGAREGRHSCRPTALVDGGRQGLPCDRNVAPPWACELILQPSLITLATGSPRVPFRKLTRPLGIVSRVRLREPRADTGAPGGEGGF